MHTRAVAAPERPLWSLSLLSNRYPALHGLRVIAILSVLQVHVTNVLAHARLFDQPKFYARSTGIWFGMDLFFVLSGFLIGSMLLGEDARDWAGIRRFYARRAFRIIPLYYLVLTLVWRLSRTDIGPLIAVKEYLYFTNYYSNVHHAIVPWGWSLCVEEHFYLAVPLLVAVIHKLKTHRARLVVLGTLWLSALLIRYAIYFGAQQPWDPGQMFLRLYVATHTRYDTLIAGVWLAYLVHHFTPQLQQWFAVNSKRWASYALAGACLAYLLVPVNSLGFTHYNIWAWGTVTSVMYAAVVMPLLLGPSTPMQRFLSARPWLYIATLGYAVYLIHIPVMDRFVKFAVVGFVLARYHPMIVWLIAMMLLCLVSWSAAYVLHLLVEKPMLWLRDRLAP
jgi:peptidoglycan/LPS O-acetylase OafA/YrhL